MAGRYGITYELRLDDGDWMDVSVLVDSRQTSIGLGICTTEFKSYVDTASFTLKAPSAYYELRAEAVNILMGAVTTAGSHAYVRITWNGQILFLGAVDASSISITTLRRPQDIQLSCKDLSVIGLDEAPEGFIVLENMKVSAIVEHLVESAGHVAGSMTMDADDDVVIRAFVADPDEKDTYRDYIDTLLFEMGGYVLDCSQSGVMNIVRIPLGDDTEGARLVDDYLDAQGVVTQTSRLETDGVEVKWSMIAETDPDEPQTVYVDDIEREVDDTGRYIGYEMEDGAYWPEDGESEQTYQEYEASFLDREYQSRQKKKADKDLSLILVKNARAEITVWDADGTQISPSDAFSYPLVAEFEETQNPTFYPTKAWYLLKNKTGEKVNLTSFSIQGDCIYRSRINTLLLPESSTRPEEYESIYVYTGERARHLATFYHDFLRYARTTHTWSEIGVVTPGTLVKIAHKTTDIGQVAYVVQVTMTFIAPGVVKSTCTAVSIGPYNEYPFREWGMNNGRNDSSASVISVDDMYLQSDSYSGVTVNTPGWRRDSGFSEDGGKYLWKYTQTVYTSGRTEKSTPVIIAVNGEAKSIVSISTQYALSYSTTEAPPDGWQDEMPLRSDMSQVMWERDKVTYSDDTIDYMNIHPVIGSRIQYAWGPSSSIPPKARLWLWRDKFMLWGRNFIGNPKQLWSDIRMDKPKGNWYLWIRWSIDNGLTWNDPQPISGNSAMDFSINGPETYLVDRDTVTVEQRLMFEAVRVNDLEGDCLWTIDEAAANTGICFENGESNIVGDSCLIVMQKGLKPSAYFELKATIGALERNRRVTATYAATNRVPLGVWPQESGDYPETATNGRRLETGDSIVWLYEDGTSTIKIYNADLDEWQDTKDPSIVQDPAYSNMLWQIVMDSMYDIANLADEGKQPANDSLGWSFFRNIGAINIIAQMIATKKLHITDGGVIYGGGYLEDGTNPTGAPGFFMSAATGLLKATKAGFQDVTISSYDGARLLLNTIKSVPGGTLTKTYTPTYWLPQTMYNALGSKGDITVDGVLYTYTKDYQPSENQMIQASAQGAYPMTDSNENAYNLVAPYDGTIRVSVSCGGGGSGPYIGYDYFTCEAEIMLNGDYVDRLYANGKSDSYDGTLSVKKGDVILVWGRAQADNPGGNNPSDPSDPANNTSAYASVGISLDFTAQSLGYLHLVEKNVDSPRYMTIDSNDGKARNNVVTGAWNSASNLVYVNMNTLGDDLEMFPGYTTIQAVSGDTIKQVVNGAYATYTLLSFIKYSDRVVFNISNGSTITCWTNVQETGSTNPIDKLSPQTQISLHVNEVEGALEFGRMLPVDTYSSIGSSGKRVPEIYADDVIASNVNATIVYGAVFN